MYGFDSKPMRLNRGFPGFVDLFLRHSLIFSQGNQDMNLTVSVGSSVLVRPLFS